MHSKSERSHLKRGRGEKPAGRRRLRAPGSGQRRRVCSGDLPRLWGRRAAQLLQRQGKWEVRRLEHGKEEFVTRVLL